MRARERFTRPGVRPAESPCVPTPRSRLLPVLLVISCNGSVEPAEHRALAERVEHMQRRLDALERQQAELEAEVAAPPASTTSAAAPVPARREVLTLRLGPAGVELDGRSIADDRLDAELRAIAEAGTTRSVLVDVDATIPHARTVALLDRVHAAGFARLAIASRGGQRDAPSDDDTGIDEPATARP